MIDRLKQFLQSSVHFFPTGGVDVSTALPHAKTQSKTIEKEINNIVGKKPAQRNKLVDELRCELEKKK